MKRRIYVHGDMGTGSAPSVGAVYTDKANVERVQRALGLTVDGKIGPNTRAAVKKFNEQRGASGDGENITDGTLAAVAGLEYSNSQKVVPSSKSSAVQMGPAGGPGPVGVPASSSDDEPGFFSMNVPGIDRPLWQVGLGTLGVFSIGLGLYLSFRSDKR